MDETQMEELKPCPFCGGKAHLIQTECLSNGVVLHHVYHSDPRCPLNPVCTKNMDTPEEAIEAWNRRAEDGN
jgi:hypothetical protein